MEQQISQELLQVYFFRAEPAYLNEIAQSLEEIGTKQQEQCHGEVDLWAPYYWLGRHSLCAIRSIRRTSGLDTFLIRNGGIPGVYDVAELMAYQWHDGNPTAPALLHTLRAARQSLGHAHLLFMSFIKLSWDLLLYDGAWPGAPSPPGRTDLVYGFAQALESLLSTPSAQEIIGPDLKLTIYGGIGDADVLLVGAVKSRRSLDILLHLANQVGMDAVGMALYGGEVGAHLPGTCVIRDTITEIGVPLELYQKVSDEARSASNISAHLEKEIEQYMSGELGGDISLKRSYTGIEALRSKLSESVSSHWASRIMLGEADIRLSSTEEVSLAEVLWLLAKLDINASQDPQFPHRLGFEWKIGESNISDFMNQRHNLVPRTGDPGPSPLAREPEPPLDAEDIDAIISYLDNARSKDLREDLRIVERMVERCITLQKNPDLPANTRYIVKQAFSRIVRIIKRIEQYGETYEEIVKEISAAASGANAAPPLKDGNAGSEMQLTWLDNAASLDRLALVNAGMHLDRALSQHVRGNINFLLSPSVYARGPDHFGSELVLSYGLSVAPRAAVHRIIEHLNDAAADTAQTRSRWYTALRTDLEIIAEPIIYASHDTDFALVPALGMIRTPRWVLWYPTYSSFVLHEVGHALAEVGELSYVASSFLKALQDPSAEEHVYALGLHDLVRGVDAESLMTSMSPELDFLIELSADVICRLFVHSRQDGSRHVEDCLDYLRIMATRMVSGERRQFLERLLGAYVASEQLFACHEEGPQVLWKNEYAEHLERLQELKEKFFNCLQTWIDKQVQNTGIDKSQQAAFLATPAIQAVSKFIQEGSRTDWLTKLGQSFGWGQFFAYLCVTRPSDTTDFSLARGQTLFHAIWRATEPTSCEEENAIEELCNTIARGTIPDVPLASYPERLARGVHWASMKLDPQQRAVPLEVRFALSLYLSNVASKFLVQPIIPIPQETL